MIRKPGHTPATPEIPRDLDHRGRKSAVPPPPGLTHEKTPENLSSQNFGPKSDRLLDVVEEPIDLHATLEACLHMVHDQAAEAGLDVNLEVGENLPKLRANARMMRQIMLNVLSNAIKFTPSGGSIAVSLQRENDTGDLVLNIRDSGIGIAPADIERVLQPFEQVASAQTNGYRGTGLGLPMAKSLIELHGGTFSIESKVDSGTTATIRLPAERTIEAE